MGKRGFTLAEILGVIVIISLLLIIIGPSVINRITGTKGDAASAGEDIVFKATDEYISDHPEDFPNGKAGRYCITIKELLDEGKLVPTGMRDGKEIYVDSVSGKDYTNLSVMVTIYSSGIRDYEIKEGDKCEELAALPIIDFLVEPSGTAWVKQRVVTILYPKLKDYTYQYKIEDGKWTDAGSLSDYNEEYYSKVLPAFTKNTTLYARARGNSVINGRIEISNIDSEKPVVRKVSVPSGWSNKNKTATATVYDGISGVKAYYLSTSSNKPSENSSGWKNVNYSKGEKTIKLNNLNNGTYYLWVKDKAGNISDTTDKSKFVVDKIDKEKPKCNISASGTKGNNNWYRGNITLNLSYSDTGGSGVDKYGMGTSSSVSYNSKKKMTQTGDTLGITYYGYVRDKAGNTNKCNITVKKDSKAPTCNVKGSGTKGDNSWYRGNVDVRLNYSDSTSGVSNYGLSTSSSVTYNKSKSATQTSDTKGTKYNGYVQDAAGNTGKCNLNVKKDVTKPSCSISTSGTSGSNGWYRGNVTLNLNYGDATSGVAGYGMSTSSVASYNSKKTMTQSADTTGTTYYGYVKDKAGNINNCNVGVKKDTKAPTCSVKGSGTKGDNDWYRSNVNVYLNYSDSGSGINNYGLSTSSSVTYNKSKSATQTSDTKGTKYNGYVQDAAGNTGKCNLNVKKDVTKPSCSISTSGTSGSNGWYRGNVTLNLNYGDATSGVAGYGMSTSSVASYNSKKTMTQSADTTGTTYYGYVKDKAGNINNCNVGVKKDTKAPTCSVKGSGTKGDNDWYRSNVNVYLNYSDSGSGINNYGLSTSSSVTYNKSKSATQTSDTKGTKYNGYVQDAAGNTGKCNLNVKKDVTKPSCSISTSGTSGSNGWYRGNVTLNLNYSDAMSGVAGYGMGTSSSANYNSKSTMTQTGDTLGTSYYGYVKDKAGNTNKCNVSVKKDTTKPSCSVKLSGTKGNNNWYKSYVNVSLSYSDSGSGIDTYGLSTSGTTTYNKSKSVTHTSDTKNVKYNGYVKDKAGNTNKCNTSFKKDATKPSCSITQSTFENYVQSVTLRVIGYDFTSGLASKPYSWLNRNSFGTSSTYTVKKNGIYNVYVKDTAGNIQNCSRSISIIASKPNKPTINNPSGGNWVNYDFSLTVSTTSPASMLGYWYYSYDAKNWTRYDKSGYNSYGKQTFVTSPYSAERNQATYIRVCNKQASGPNDTANCSDYASTMIKIDKTAPALSRADMNGLDFYQIDGNGNRVGAYMKDKNCNIRQGRCTATMCLVNVPGGHTRPIANYWVIDKGSGYRTSLSTLVTYNKNNGVIDDNSCLWTRGDNPCRMVITSRAYDYAGNVNNSIIVTEYRVGYIGSGDGTGC